jgi:outer membrane murein-binding lipoprotein Lpp
MLKGCKGSGWHMAEYPNKKSDLIKGRAQERVAQVDELVEKRNKMVAETRAAHKKKRA